MNSMATGRVLRQSVRALRRAQSFIDDSETSVSSATDSFLKLPFDNQKDILCHGFFLAITLVGHRYHEIFTHLSSEEKLVLYLLAVKLNKLAVAVEIGSFLGASACFLALGLSRKGRLYCVDTWNNDAMDQAQRDTFDEFSENTQRFRDKIIPLRGTSRDIATKVNLKIDFLFIDGDHSYDACLNDWLSWSRMLTPGAIVVFHDVGWAEGVMKVVAEFVAPIAKREVKMNNMYVAWL
jgi:predicted O-methyltransferase YrrM